MSVTDDCGKAALYLRKGDSPLARGLYTITNIVSSTAKLRFNLVKESVPRSA
jgi:hypothetical protein